MAVTNEESEPDFDPGDFAAFFRHCKYEPYDDGLRIFGVDMTPTLLQLANALLHKIMFVDEAMEILKAAKALQDVTGNVRIAESDVTRDWNRFVRPGQVVEVFPDGPDGESFLTRTESPAFDTLQGAVVIVADMDQAIGLENVRPSTVDCPEFAP